MRKLLIVFLFLFSFSPMAAWGQSASPFFKDSATTIVGSAEPTPSTNPSPSTRPPGESNVPNWADTFTSNLALNGDYYTRLTTAITNPETRVTIPAGNYVCTGLVRSAFKLAGEKAPENGLAVVMQHNWKSVNGGDLINYTQDNTLLRFVRPGDAFFQLKAGNFLDGFSEHNHVSIVYTIDVDANGDGTMVTREANAWHTTSINVRFQSWKMYAYDWHDEYNIFLFGLRK